MRHLRELHSLTEDILNWIDADAALEATDPTATGRAVEEPMRDRYDALDRLWREDGRRMFRLGIPSIWT